MMRTVRWEDLAHPGHLIRITFNEAFATIPTLLVVGAVFFLGMLGLSVIRRVLVFITMKLAKQPYTLKKWVATKKVTGPEMNETHWISGYTHSGFNLIHVAIESIFFIGCVLLSVLAFSFAGVDIWQNPVAVSVVILVVTYVFATGLQQMGSGYFFFLNNCMTPREYWEQVGGGISGRVCNITPFFIEFESRDPEHGGMLLQRASMTSVFMSNWQRNFKKEREEPPLSKDDVNLPPTAVPVSQRVKDF